MWPRNYFEKWTDEEYEAILQHPVVEKKRAKGVGFVLQRVIDRVPMTLYFKAYHIACAHYNKDSFVDLIKALDNMNAAYQDSLKKDRIEKIKKAARLYDTH